MIEFDVFLCLSAAVSVINRQAVMAFWLINVSDLKELDYGYGQLCSMLAFVQVQRGNNSVFAGAISPLNAAVQ